MSIDSARRFFGPRAAGWEDRFAGDDPAFEAALAALAPARGGTALDAGCGTGRALPMLRRAVGDQGVVIGIDVTPEMLAEAAGKGRRSLAHLLLGDVRRLPLGAGSVDAILAAGMLSHLEDPHGGLVELSRVARPGAGLALFHPIGRASLAARHGHPVDPRDVRAEPAIRNLLAASDWVAESVDDAAERYLVVARRAG